MIITRQYEEDLVKECSDLQKVNETYKETLQFIRDILVDYANQQELGFLAIKCLVKGVVDGKSQQEKRRNTV